jgi:hypothetical protein
MVYDALSDTVHAITEVAFTEGLSKVEEPA